jgi:CheY-like chemotaxis protein
MSKNANLPTVCLIDDDKIYQFTAKRILELLNPLQKVLVFSNGREALDFFSQFPLAEDDLPDVIFLDINMPVLNGWEFLEGFAIIKANICKNIHIYMVSSSIDENDKIRCKNYETVKDFIIKPINKQMMVDILQMTEMAV